MMEHCIMIKQGDNFFIFDFLKINMWKKIRVKVNKRTM